MELTSLSDLEGVQVGHVSDNEALTGCTAVLFPAGAVMGHVAWGTATGSRELEALRPRHVVERIHAVCLSGGSAFGLAAASGVMRRLEQEGIGHETSFGRVPIVAGAVVFDLNLGDGAIRPDEHMGARAADLALREASPASGNVGAGTGTSAGKLLGPQHATKTGLGNSGVRTEDGLEVAALAVVNPVGDVLDPATGRLLAGCRRTPESRELAGTSAIIRGGARCAPLHANTTLCVLGTNCRLGQVEARWVAEQGVVALGRTIEPPFTRHDGDIVFCASVGTHAADLHLVGLLARDVITSAIVDACRRAAPAGGLPSCHGLSQP